MDPHKKEEERDAGIANANLGIDFVILYNYGKADDETRSVDQFRTLIQALSSAGLDTEVRPGNDSTLLVFIRAPERSLRKAVHRLRVRDWLHGIRQSQPTLEDEDAGKPTHEAERLQAIYHMIALPKKEGGAGIAPQCEDWPFIEALFPLHHQSLNREWIRAWSSKTFLSTSELDDIRDVHGERVAFYFAFLQFYFGFLMFPACIGLTCWVLFPGFSIIYGIANAICCMIYVELWKRRQADLNIRWQTKGVSAIRMRRREFKPDIMQEDELTEEMIPIFPVWKRVCRQLLQIPLVIVCIVTLGTIIAGCFAIEILLSEVYDGPFKTILTLVPTILVSALVPTFSGMLTGFAKKLNDFENYETVDAYESALVHKHFVIDFVTNYLPVLLTAFVYVPLGPDIVPRLNVFGAHTMSSFSNEKADKLTPMKEFKINRSRLRDQVIYFAITAQIVGQITEIGFPFAKRKLLQKWKEYQAKKAEEKGEKSEDGKETPQPTSKQVIADAPEEEVFLRRVRDEATLDQYDIVADYQEMVVQFGHLSLFSVVWPLVPLAFLCNNWVELRSDFVKICLECRRPIPMRSEGIGSWLDSLEFLAWLGSVTTAAILYIFRTHGDGDGGLSSQVVGWLLLLTITFSEHAYLLLRWLIRTVIANVETPTRKIEKAVEYLVRKDNMERMAKQEEDRSREKSAEEDQPQNKSASTEDETSELSEQKPSVDLKDDGEKPADENEKFNRKTLEEDARAASVNSTGKGDMFWRHQRNWKESAMVGVHIITKGPAMKAVEEEDDEKKKEK